MLTLPNYQIGTQIYESANSLVYRGVRKKDNQPVILKVLKEDYPTPAELTRYQQEYEITKSLDLDGVVKTYDIEKYQNTLIIILEDFGGESLKQLMIKNPLTVKEFLPIAIQIADTLGQIHAANIIHKDINPTNIVWNQATNQLKIIDFGITSRLPRENPTLKNPEQLEGTLAYISPEQTGRMNRSLDYRTDLYSLGVTFYELLTGKVPFESDSAMELVHCHIAKTPIPVDKINPDIPPIISDIVMKLMAKNVEDRYQSAFGVKADLQKVQEKTDEENLPGFKNLAGLDFELAQNDFSGKLQIPQKLYGRENEINTLLQAFERVSQGAAEMMLVAGYSGVGKTALVNEVHKPMTEKHGYFASGKFDQFQKNIPYSAISQAFNKFCRYLLMENAETLAVWQTKILDAVGNNGQIIIDVIPDLELVIGPQPTVAQVGPTEAQNRFQLFFINFIKVLCNKEHPFILFIDDLQWVDSASLDLLKRILLDSEVKHLFIIGAYRDNEVDSSHPLMMAISELQKANAIINTIKLANLLRSDVNHLLRESLACETEQAQSLTDLIYQKTQGNAFFTHQFLQTLYQDALLRFDFEQRRWQWNVEQIAAQNITANVVELMANKIDKLPSNTSKALQLAACIGNQFELSLLAIIYEQAQNETLEVLTTALAEGLILPLDENYKRADLPHSLLSKERREGMLEKSQFKFLHDRVQQAAYALIGDEQKQVVHLQIGRLLLKNTPANTLENKVFEIVGQFNQGLELLNNQTERLKIAELNLLAGQKAKMATAYGAALNYLSVGRSCLTETSWKTDYPLTFALYKECYECAYLNIQFEQAEELFNIIINHVENTLHKSEIYAIYIRQISMQAKYAEAIQAGKEILKELGMELPPDEELPATTQKEIREVKNNRGNRDFQTLLAMPLIDDPEKKAILGILMDLCSPTYFHNIDLFRYIMTRTTNLGLTEGNFQGLPHSYTGFGEVFVSIII
ncbi:Serine/Threonine protein kinase and Signal Transduction Histidine Kinase (STHK) with GAF sensor [Beggiatoa sp. PS]|nr:Serine/Threonine protein kinase and Signal Transduction Histidine Kinase (STHK) with GAF sensor [Beggiatoa sp. PS]